jgi:cell fate regulator YaaT (PSP1 superfamily)
MLAVELERVGKPHLYPEPDFELVTGERVVVETARGTELGRVISTSIPFVGDTPNDAFRAIRAATDADLKKDYQNRIESAQAFSVAKDAILALGLDMRLLEARLTLNQERIVFFFWAEGRVDFRVLVRELVSLFRCRIELHQVGSRDRAKMMGGIGVCGRTCCCTLWLREFSSVSIRLAREQQLHVKPDKISGVCGRLMCCLKYEYETYRALRQEMPSPGSELDTPDGLVIVLDVDPINRTLLVKRPAESEDERERIYRIPLGRAKLDPSHGCTSCSGPQPEEHQG